MGLPRKGTFVGPDGDWREERSSRIYGALRRVFPQL